MSQDASTPNPGATPKRPEVVAATRAPTPTNLHGLSRVGWKYGHRVYRFRWLIIAAWLIAVVVSVPFALKVAGQLQSGGYSLSGSESDQVAGILTHRLRYPASQALVVFHSTTTPTNDPAYQREVNSFVARARTFPHVTTVTVGGIGRDGRTTVVAVSFDRDAQLTEGSIPAFRALLPNGASAGPARVYLTGEPATLVEYSAISQQDVERAESFTLPLALLILLLVFGTVVAAAMPLALAFVAVPVALAVIYAIAAHTWTHVFVLNVATIIGLGLSIDYSLFLVRRFREELARRHPVAEALGWSVATAGEAILFSGLTVLIGFSGLFLMGIPIMDSFGIGGIVVVAASLLAALTLLPALLAVLGARINAIRLPFKYLARLDLRGWLSRVSRASHEAGGLWHVWALRVMRRPVVTIVAALAALLLLSWPLLSITIGTYGSVALPRTSETAQGLELLRTQFKTTSSEPIYVIARAHDGSNILTSNNLALVADLADWIADQPHITSVIGLTRPPPGAEAAPSPQELIGLYATGAFRAQPALAQLVAATTNDDLTLLTVQTDAPLDSPEGQALIDHLRGGDPVTAHSLEVLVGGTQALSVDFTRYLYGHFPRAILFIVAATYLLLLFMFRSLLLPLKAIVMNVLSVGAAFGVLVFVFQQGHFERILDFTANGFVDSTIPILIFCALFGLSMDYEVFLLSRIHEEWLQTGDNTQAVARGLEKTAGVITSAALLFIIVTGAFMFTSLLTTKEFGLGITVAILVDATIIRLLLVPATMRIMGQWNWWTPGLSRGARE